MRFRRHNGATKNTCKLMLLPSLFDCIEPEQNKEQVQVEHAYGCEHRGNTELA